MTSKFIIARRAAKFFHDGDVVNLGIGIPGACAEFSEDGVMFETENGYLGCGAKAEGLDVSEGYCNASGVEFIPVRGAATLTSAQSFGMIRGGRVDAAVLGGLQVSEQGDLANWGMPGRAFGMGGEMDLVNGAKKVIVAMEMLTLPAIIERATPEDLASLRVKLRDMDTLIDLGDVETLSPLTRSFHAQLTSLCHQNRILRVIEGQDEFITRFSAMAIRKEPNLKEAHKEHYRLVELVEQKDLEGFRELMQHHIEASKKNCLVALEEQRKGQNLS